MSMDWDSYHDSRRWIADGPPCPGDHGWPFDDDGNPLPKRAAGLNIAAALCPVLITTALTPDTPLDPESVRT